MAGDWIKVEVVLPDKPEVWAIAGALNLDPDAVVGKLVRVFSWFNLHTENCHAPSVTKTLLDRLVGVTGFANSLVSVGWLVDEKGEIFLKNADRHNGSSAKSRALTNTRQSRHRNAKTVTEALPEKRREEKNKKTKTPVAVATELPDFLNTESWMEWIEYRKQSKKKMTPATVEKQFAFLQKYDHATQRAIINRSIEKGWQGLFPPEEFSNANTQNFTRQPADTRRLSGAERTRQLREELRQRELANESPDLGCVGAD